MSNLKENDTTDIPVDVNEKKQIKIEDNCEPIATNNNVDLTKPSHDCISNVKIQKQVYQKLTREEFKKKWLE